MCILNKIDINLHRWIPFTVYIFSIIEVGSDGSQRFHFRVPNRNSILISLTFPKILYGKSLAPHSRRYRK